MTATVSGAIDHFSLYWIVAHPNLVNAEGEDVGEIGVGTRFDASVTISVNAAFDQLEPVQLALRDLGQERRILELLDDDSGHVRLWAGFDALYFSPDEGLRVLRELEQMGGRDVGMLAWSTLQEWESGELVLIPWVDEK